GEDEFLSLALENARFILDKVVNGNEKEWQLLHSYKDGKANISAYLEDYALLIEAWVALYQISFDLKWLERAEGLANYAIVNFYDEKEEMFFFTDAQAESLIARKKELFDNVIPASNSVMAKALYQLGLILDKPYFVTLSQKMTARIKNLLHKNVEYLANWAQVYIYQGQASAEIVILGDQYWETSAELNRRYLPNKVILASKNELEHPPLFQNRKISPGETKIFVCYDKACQLPVSTIEEAWAQIK
ncbi:MAG: thioredoxin domain-containing protein, partial [Bacteroidota bacterium]